MTAANSSRVLLIKAKGGFGNRMLSAATGIVLADLTDRVPVIDWRDGMYLPAGVNAYPLLFDSPISADLAQIDGRVDVVPKIWSGRLDQHPVDLVQEFFPSKHSSPFVYRKLSIELARPDSSADVAVFWSYLPKMARLRRLTRHSDRYRGLSDDEILASIIYTHFRPNERVRQSVQSATSWSAGNAIGVHVRYTDRKVPLTKIEAALERLRRQQPEAPVFLATDSAIVERRIRSQVADVHTIEKAFAQGAGSLHDEGVFADPLREAENALVDMWALARSRWLIHSRNSTFSVSAALIGSIPHDRQVDVERYDPRLVAKRLIQSRA